MFSLAQLGLMYLLVYANGPYSLCKYRSQSSTLITGSRHSYTAIKMTLASTGLQFQGEKEQIADLNLQYSLKKRKGREI